MNKSNFNAKDRFEIGGEELLISAKNDPFESDPDTEEETTEIRQFKATLDDIRIRIGTLLKTETVSLLLGAGASVDCGGQLIGSVPLQIEQNLNDKGITGVQQPRVRQWLKVFYLAVRCASGNSNTPVTRQEILSRHEALKKDEAEPLQVNLESVLATLYRWHSVLFETGKRLRVDSTPQLDIKWNELDICLMQVTRALAHVCHLPTADNKTGLTSYVTLVRKLLTRPLNLKRVNIFTLNYDTLVEQATDASGVALLDGFVGVQNRVFRPESYEQDLYFPAETTEGHVHRFDRVLHLYKLHGSITWTANEPKIDNPYGVSSTVFNPDSTQPLLIYPTPAKYGEILGSPYSELFRRFASTLARPQSTLFAIGYGFGDEHVNSIIRQALAIPSFTLVIVDPSPNSAFVTKLRKQQDQRIWISEGPTLGTFTGFVKYMLPDLRDEEIRKKVLATHQALTKSNPVHGGSPNGI